MGRKVFKVDMIAVLTVVMVLMFCSCGDLQKKDYDTIGELSFSDQSILTEDEKEKLAELKERKEKLIEEKDEAGIEALKTEWEEFKEPIQQFIDKYDSAKETFFSNSEKSMFTSEEQERCTDIETRMATAYKSRDEAGLDAVVTEWNTYSSSIRKLLDLYKSIEIPDFSEQEKALLTQEELSERDSLKTRKQIAWEEQNADELRNVKAECDDLTTRTARAKKEYISVSDYSIEGKWKNIGNGTFGQAQAGAIIAFDGKNCNYVSPLDTYAFYKDGDHFKLDCTTPFGDTLSFTVKILDDDHIDVYRSGTCVELGRIE